MLYAVRMCPAGLARHAAAVHQVDNALALLPTCVCAPPPHHTTHCIGHLCQELREGGLMSNLDHLTEAAAGAAADIQSLQKAVLTDDNVRALRSAVLTLCKTLEHVESISADVSVFSRDTGVQRNLKTLITALSRIIEE